MKGAAIQYSAVELAWVQLNSGLPRRELHEKFCSIFERTDVSQPNLTALCKRKGWLTGRTGQFTQGQESWNKGKPMPSHPNSRRTQFQKGKRSGVATKLWKPIGTERVTRNGYLECKIHDDLPLQSRWRAVHLIRWEDAHGPLPKGHALKCLDGDKANTDPENWVCVPRALLPRLNGRFGRNYDDAPDELKPLIMKVVQLEHAAREKRKAKP